MIIEGVVRRERDGSVADGGDGPIMGDCAWTNYGE